MRDAVVITGASTGIGAAAARRLAAAGYHVFGTVRRPEDGARLEQEGISPVRMDVTDQDSVLAARDHIAERLKGARLLGLVNNAGIAMVGPLEHLPIADLRLVLETNVVGTLAATQAFLPLLRRSRGRVVNISSVAGRLALPFAGPYAASKFALEALSDSLRWELRPFGIAVVVIQPGSVTTPIWEKLAGTDLARFRDTAYGEVLPRILKRSVSSGRRGLGPDAVADAVHTALSARRPPARILVARRPLASRLVRWLPDGVLDRRVARALRAAGFGNAP